MTRPASHREQEFDRSCGNCFFAHSPEYKRDLLCFFGDKIEINRWGFDGKIDKVDVRLDGDDVGLMEGEEYSQVWGGRVVDPVSDVCDEWKLNASETTG